MPQEFHKYQDKSLDGRVKITPDQYPEVRRLYGETKSSRKVAEVFGVDKKIILFIVNPGYKARDRERRIKDKVWLKYYDKEKHTKAMRKYRAKKREHNLAVKKTDE